MNSNSNANRKSFGPGKAIAFRNSNAHALGSIQTEFSSLNLQDNYANKRLSMIPPRQSMDSRQSISRRSLAPGGMASAAGAVLKDPRNIRDKSYQLSCIKTLIKFLSESGYDAPISPKILTSPSTKDFQHIFKFLYWHLDPTYEAGSKKFEEELPVLLKGLKYPFANDITKSHLQSIGAIHAWPTFLAMLTWMVELILVVEQINTSPTSSTETEDKSSTEKIFFEYLTKAYYDFLYEINSDGMLKEFSAKFDKKNSHIVKEIDLLEREINSMMKEQEELVAKEAFLPGFEKERNEFKENLDKFKDFLKHLSIKKQKLSASIEADKSDLSTSEFEIKKMEEQKTLIVAQIQAQPVSPEDIDRMNSEREQLSNILESLQAQREEIQKVFWEREIQTKKKLDLVEKKVQEYNFNAENICIIPVDASNSEGLQLDISLKASATRHEEILNVDLKAKLLPDLQMIRQKHNDLSHTYLEKSQQLSETFDKLNDLLIEKRDALSRLQDKIQRMEEQYNFERDNYFNEQKRSSDETEKLEAELRRIKIDITNQFLTSQQQLQRTSIEHDQLIKKLSDEREKANKDLFKLMEEMISFRSHIETSLTDFQSFIEAEYQHIKSSSNSKSDLI